MYCSPKASIKILPYLLLFMFLSPLVHAETLSFTTYYPAPFGAYDTLRLIPRAAPPTCNNTVAGGLYMDINSVLQICRDPGTGFAWLPLSTAWTQNGDNIYPTDTATRPNLNVGIGLTTPTGRLIVRGAGTTTGIGLQTQDSAGTVRVTTLDNGNVGIGLGAVLPTGKLIVRGAGTATGIGLQTQDSAGTVRFTTLDNGNVGIGIAAPAGKLIVKGAGTTTGIGLQTQDSAGTVRLTTLDNGNVGIGLGAVLPTGKLIVRGVGTTTGIGLQTQNSSGTPLLTTLDNGTVGMKIATPTGSPGIIHTAKAGSQFSVPPLMLFDIHDSAWASNNDIQLHIGDLVINSRKGGAANIEAMNDRGGNGNLVIGAEGDVSFITQNTNPATDYKMIIANNGNVGIGNVNPLAKLDVKGVAVIGDTAVGGGGTLVIRGGLGAGGHLQLNVAGDGTAVGTPDSWSIDQGAFAGSNLRIYRGTGCSGCVGAIEITSNNNVGISNNAPIQKLDVIGNINASGNIYAAGTITSSDQRLKENIRPLTHTLISLDQLRGVTFEWNELAVSKLGVKKGEKNIGLIAQEVQKVYPQLVIPMKHSGGQEFLGVDYLKFTAVLLEALKELKGEVDSLMERIKVLEKGK